MKSIDVFSRKYKYPLCLYGMAFVFISTAWITTLLVDIDFSHLVRDPIVTYGNPDVMNSIRHGERLVGLVSNVGILCWSIGFSICLFCYFLLSNSRHPDSRFFLQSGIFTLMLTLDDFFLIHEGPQQRYVLAFYAIFFSYFFIQSRKILLSSDSFLFWMAVTFFMFSAIVDLVPLVRSIVGIVPLARVVIEDSLKFLGIVSWSGFLAQYSFDTLNRVLTGKLAR